MNRQLGSKSVEKDAKTIRALTQKTIACRVYNNAAFTVGNDAYTAVTFNAERSDTTGMHSTSSNSSRITFALGGWYLVGGHVRFAANATGIRQAGIRLDGSTYIAMQSDNNPDGTYTTIMSVSVLYYFAATNYVELVGYQNSGGDLNILATAAYSPEFWAIRLP